MPVSMLQKLWTQLYEMRCEDLGIKVIDKQLIRFLQGVAKHLPFRRLALNDMGFGSHSAPVLCQLLRVGGSIQDWTHVNLSLNKLGLNLAPILNGLRKNTKLVSLRLANNDLGSNMNHVHLIRTFLMEHPSLTSIDLSNDDSNLNKNRLSNIGLEAVIDAMLDPRSLSVISMINFAQNNILSSQPETFR
jgi:hypothetical protein